MGSPARLRTSPRDNAYLGNDHRFFVRHIVHRTDGQGVAGVQQEVVRRVLLPQCRRASLAGCRIGGAMTGMSIHLLLGGKEATFEGSMRYTQDFLPPK